MTFGAGIQKWAEIPSLWGKQGYGYTEAVEGLGVDIKLQDAMSTAKKKHQECIKSNHWQYNVFRIRFGLGFPCSAKLFAESEKWVFVKGSA